MIVRLKGKDAVKGFQRKTPCTAGLPHLAHQQRDGTSPPCSIVPMKRVSDIVNHLSLTTVPFPPSLPLLKSSRQPVEALIETVTRSGTACLDIPLPVAKTMQTQLVGHFRRRHGVR